MLSKVLSSFLSKAAATLPEKMGKAPINAGYPIHILTRFDGDVNEKAIGKSIKSKNGKLEISTKSLFA